MRHAKFTVGLILLILLHVHSADATEIRQLDAAKMFGGGLARKKVFLGRAPDHRAAFCKGRTRDKPVVIRDKMTLAAVFENETIRDRIARQVDFRTEQLIIFAWEGRSGERMSARVDESDGVSVIFSELPRIGDGFLLTHHAYFYVIGKDDQWSLGPAPEGVE